MCMDGRGSALEKLRADYITTILQCTAIKEDDLDMRRWRGGTRAFLLHILCTCMCVCVCVKEGRKGNFMQ